MKYVAILWIVVFAVAAISIGSTHEYMISPLWVVNALAGFYLVRLRKHIAHPIAIFLFCFSTVFVASFIFDGYKDVATKALLATIGALQIQCFISAYYAVALNAKHIKYQHTALLSLPNLVASLLGSLLFMLLFEVGENYYEFIDYFLEQMTTGLAVLCILTGMHAWRKIGWQDYFYLMFASIIQYLISMDRIFYACLILPLLMCFYALRHSIREFAWLIGVLVLLCSIYVSLPLAGEYWSDAEVYMLSRISAYRLSLGLYLIVFLFICEMYIVNRRLYRSLERMTFNDELTNLSTRRYVKQLIEQAPFAHGSAILLDVDNFKLINDNHGHHVGDLVLQHMAHLLKSICPASAVISRWGGEEFLVLLPHYDEYGCKRVCEQIIQGCAARPFVYGDLSIVMTFSVGATSFQFFNLDNYAQVLQHVDGCLYEAKGAGKNRYVYA
jgi:diguanylate cyclase (GGDEF)-like protein